MKQQIMTLLLPVLPMMGYAQQADSVDVGFRTFHKQDMMGAVSSVNVAELTQKNYMT